MKTLTDRGVHLRILQIVSRAIFAGLVAIGSIDHIPTIIAGEGVTRLTCNIQE